MKYLSEKQQNRLRRLKKRMCRTILLALLLDLVLAAVFWNEYRVNTPLALGKDEICCAEEIFGVASDEIKSTHPASSRISSPQGISSSKTICSIQQGGFS